MNKKLFKWKYIFITFGLISVIIIASIMNLKTTFANLTEKKPVPNNDDPGQRILVVVPHPDDESLGMAGVIQKAIELKRPIKVVIVTDGESYKKAAQVFTGHINPTPADFYKLGLQRHSESLAAMSVLGLPKNDVIFLGFADGSTRFLWSDFWDNGMPRISGGTNVAYSPYKDVYKPGVAYTGENLENELQDIMKSFKPTDIYYPLADDVHPDHWAVSNFTRYAITALNLNAKEHMFLVHHPQWPVPWLLMPNDSLLPPTDMKDSNTVWHSIPLSKQEEAKKEEAIKQYTSQIKVMEPFLLAFVRKNELFGTKPVITIPEVETKPNLYDKNMPFSLLSIPAGGILDQEIYKSADLTKLASFYYDNHLYIGVQTLSPISKDVRYNIEMRLFYNNSIKRIDLGLINDKLYQYKKANNSLLKSVASRPIIDKNILWIKLNVPQKQDLRYIFLGSDSIYKGRLIDRIPWNLYKISKQA